MILEQPAWEATSRKADGAKRKYCFKHHRRYMDIGGRMRCWGCYIEKWRGKKKARKS